MGGLPGWVLSAVPGVVMGCPSLSVVSCACRLAASEWRSDDRPLGSREPSLTSNTLECNQSTTTGVLLVPLKTTFRLAVVLSAGLAAAVALPAAASPQAGRATTERVLVTGVPGAAEQVRNDVRADGGRDIHVLDIIDGVSAVVPRTALSTIATQPGVRSVSPDAAGHLMGIDPTLGYDVSNDEGSLYDVAQITHAKDAWGQSTGKGVDVALIDSGVSPVKGLTSGNVINGPDLSFESQDPDLAHLDTFGHGTHMASIIVGRDAASTPQTYQNANSHQFVGLAPDARLVSIKVASADGGADVSQVIAAIDWVTEHAHSGGLNIKVLNLSYGTNSTQSPSNDPLDYAVENAWRAGITVVVSAGNDGANGNRLTDPANDPLVIAVGADDPEKTNGVNDDQPAAFSQLGSPTGRHIDVLAPGVHIIGLRDPGSYIDQNNPSAVVNGRFFRGSGTSQAAAVVSGLAALYISKYPTATPDQVKNALMSSAQVPDVVKHAGFNIGVPDINKALGQRPAPGYTQPATGDTGTGSLEAARGTSHVETNGVELTGEQDIFGQAWNGPAWAAASRAGTTWDSNGEFNGQTWTGSDWSGQSWTASTWAGHSWTDNDWSGHSWTGYSWTGHSWTDSGWDGHSWTDSSWDADGWDTSTWADDSWS
jgi:serine protease AprX